MNIARRKTVMPDAAAVSRSKIVRVGTVRSVRLAAVLVMVISTGLSLASRTTSQVSRGTPNGPRTFTKDVALVLFRHCVECHRESGSAPFSLLEYEDARKRANLIVAMTQSRLMPPWKPEPGYGEFIGS